jgi:hypothetical protein
MVGIEHDPNTGWFTAASFANFPDELLDLMVGLMF